MPVNPKRPYFIFHFIPLNFTEILSENEPRVN